MNEFEKKLESLLKIANKNNNTVSTLDIDNLCEEDDNDEMYNALCSELKKQNITINEDYDEDKEDEPEIDLKEIEEEQIDLSNESFAQIENDYRKNDSVRLYLLEIGRIPLLSLEEEKKITMQIYEANLASKKIEEIEAEGENYDNEEYMKLKKTVDLGNIASEKLVNANLRLVIHVSKKYTNNNMEFLDLIQEGNMGLIKAIDKYDPFKGYKFSTYATWWIRQAITRAISDQSRTIRIPVHVNEQLARIRRAEKELVQIIGRDPSDEEIANKLGISLSKLQRLKALNETTVSLSNPVGEEQDSSLEDFIPDENKLNPYEHTRQIKMREEIDEVLNRILNYRERTILEMRFGLNGEEPKTLEEVGKVFNVTRERIRQIEAKALRKIRYSKSCSNLREYLSKA